MKEIHPDMVATFTAPVGVFEGHPFIIEAGVALGGATVEGLTVYRFANRIPLLFEGGSDVATITAARRVNWASYKIDINKDKVGVFVSLVSTKVPFKGTGKEYIGDDIEEIQVAVRSALMSCAAQLRVKLMRAQALRARADRRKNLIKYVPDVVRALLGSFKSMADRRAGGGGGGGEEEEEGLVDSVPKSSFTPLISRKRSRDKVTAMQGEYSAGKLTEVSLSAGLMDAVNKADVDVALEHAAATTKGLIGGVGGGVEEAGEGNASGGPVFLAPAGSAVWAATSLVHADLAVFQFLPGLWKKPEVVG